MLTNRASLGTALLILQAALASAQDSMEKIWGVFAYTLHGDSTPKALASSPRSRVLTEYGAASLSAAGSTFRDRYVTASSGDVGGTGIEYISPYILDQEEVAVLSTTEQYVVASAQAFMQGLYPPLGQTLNTSYYDNGAQFTSPLNGYQYPRVVTVSLADPQSITLAGQAKCSKHQAAEKEYQDSSHAQAMTQEYDVFYTTLWREALAGLYDASSVTYTNAVDISNYLDYEFLHNGTLTNSVDEEDLKRARWLADQYTYATNSQNSSSQSPGSGGVNAIAGQTLALNLLGAFEENIQKVGLQWQMTLLFGSDEPAVALASLMGLAAQSQSNFYSRPVRGGSLVFELYSIEEKPNSVYPSPENLYVRFFLHNGTSSSTKFESFPLFGHGPSRSFISYSEFRAELEQLAVSSIQDWCLRCNSSSVFCVGVVDQEKKHMSPAVAGVIGAVVTLVVIGLLAIVGFLVCGARRRQASQPSVGGFKGTSKLASDTDVTFRNPSWAMSKAESAQNGDDLASGVIVQGHERVGSWEMVQQRKESEQVGSARHAQTRSPFEEEIEEEWRNHSGLKPVKVRENV